ncbi:LamG-like jellyroll fold domain-containing protein [Winogradskyella sp.]|uniref:LamG-like jellyroll fold domain-containing protein n=1 Tax=Winogradskyella sp. TaxID=1883156 RepID=UPI0037045842
MHLEVSGGNTVTQGSAVTINAGTTVQFTITNIETSNCQKLKVKDVDISNMTDFDINPNNPNRNIKPESCNGGHKFLDFEIENISGSCSTASTLVTVEIKNQPDFTFTLEVISAPVIYVLGGDPYEDIYNGDTATSEVNGTDFGVVEEAATETRTYIIANIGSCDLDITAISSNNSDFATSSPYVIPYLGLDPFYYIVFNVNFTAPVGGTGVQNATITIDNSDTLFTFAVSAEMFNENIPGPGGITADFRLWLKSTRGINETNSSVSLWEDKGTNGKDAQQPVLANQPTYLDDAVNNINFNPVIKFENDGGSTEQFLYNDTNGFYSQDIFIVMIPDNTVTSASNQNTILAGLDSGNAGDITGVGFGNYSSEFTNETLSYNQDVAGGGAYNGYAELNTSYDKAGIINIRNDSDNNPTGQEILYNSNQLTTSSVDDVAFDNVGDPGPPVVLGTRYWIGKNYDIQGSLNGRVAEIFTFAERVDDNSRQKIESYLAIKYGITLGANNEAEKDYKNSWGTTIWKISDDGGQYNYNVAGIGRDSISDLYQKQSKTINTINDVTIGLGQIYDTNSANINEFMNDGDFLVWGNNNLSYTGSNTNSIDLGNGVSTTFTRIDRTWKIEESTEVINSDVGDVYVSIPETAFSAFPLGPNEEYALMVADGNNLADDKIIDVIPLKPDGAGSLQTWYNFDGKLFFTFGKVQNFTGDYAVNIDNGEYLVGESNLNLNDDVFTVSAWIKSAPSANVRTIVSKGEKLQMRLNTSNQIEIIIDNTVTPKATSTMQISDDNWHNVCMVYNSGTIFLYVDGILDKTVLDIVGPSPNFNKFAIGAVYLDKDNIINSLRGEVDDLRIWDVALSTEQVRYVMNQEIERLDISGTDYVGGSSLPGSSDSNLVASIPWSSLRAYYDFNSFYGSTVEGKNDARNFLRLHYLDKDKKFIENQTAPLPYVSISDGDWDSAATWSTNSNQLPPNSLGLDGVTEIKWNIVEINHNINSGDKNITLKGLKHNSGTFTIANPNETLDETNSGHSLTITNYLELDGVIDLVGESQLIQTDDSVLDADSGGYIERDQQGTANSFNYNYWSSSVGPITGNSATRGTGVSYTNPDYTLENVLNDGTDSGAYESVVFNSASDASDNGNNSPIVISTNWMFTFYGPADDYLSWSAIDELSNLKVGEGFTMKGSSGNASVTNFQNYVFKGLPNNGDVLVPLELNVTGQNPSGNVTRLVGNPYPSAIDAVDFILDNMSIADGGNNANGTIFNGALYFWDHFGEENSHEQGNYIGGYATFNLLGGVAAISNSPLLNNTSDNGNAATGTKIPGPYIPVNQGFFVSTALEGYDNDNGQPIATVDGGNIIFKNSQRIFEREAVGNSQFMRNANIQDLNEIPDYTNPLIRLEFTGPTGLSRQIALGYNINATSGLDIGYDAILVDENREDMYWNTSNHKLVIEGEPYFNQTDEFPIGIKVSDQGVIKIGLDAIEHMDEDITVFIKDNETGLTTQINDNPLELILEPGVYEYRFSVVFIGYRILSNEEVSFVDKDMVLFYDETSKRLVIVSSDYSSIIRATIFNIVGQTMHELKPDSERFTYPINAQSGVYLIQFDTEFGKFTKRFVIN